MGQRVDEPLNAEGLKQVNQLAQDFLGKGFEVIFTSPLKRAYQTAKIIADKINVPILERKELLERDFGELSGKTWDEIASAVGQNNVNFKETDLEQKYNYRPYRGESVDDVKERLMRFIEELRKNYLKKKVLIVAHGGILKLAHFLFLEKKINTPDNASIYEFEI